jgi:hypothetical protein
MKIDLFFFTLLFLKYLPNRFGKYFEKEVYSNLKKKNPQRLNCCSLPPARCCLQTRNNNILEWEDCKSLYNTPGKIPDLQHVSYIDLKLSPNIFQDNLKRYLENKHYEKILHVDLHDWDNKQSILDSELWNDFIEFTYECDTSGSDVYLEILNKPLKTFKNNPFIESYVLDKLKSIDYSKFQWIGYYHFTREQEVTYVEFPDLIIHSQLKLSNYPY